MGEDKVITQIYLLKLYISFVEQAKCVMRKSAVIPDFPIGMHFNFLREDSARIILRKCIRA